MDLDYALFNARKVPCRVNESLVQVPFAMDAAVIAMTLPGEPLVYSFCYSCIQPNTRCMRMPTCAGVQDGCVFGVGLKARTIPN